MLLNQTRIVAIVISFNRLGMVRRCVESLRSQTRAADAILVVDGSTQPEVRAWLDAQTDVTKLYIDDLGSAGGFYHGMQWAVEQGFDWLWMMDDDVVTASDALQELERAMSLRPEVRVLNSYATAEDDPSVPAVGALCWRNNSNDYLRGVNLYTTAQVLAHADTDGFLDSVGGQFAQGTLFHRSMIEQVGLPLLPLFTRGDEVEYTFRLMRAGYHMYSFVPSRVTHPRARILFIDVFGKKLPCGATNVKQRYYSLRNSIYVRKTYYGGLILPYAARRFMGGIVAELYWGRKKSWREQLRGWMVVARGVRDGLRLKIE